MKKVLDTPRPDEDIFTAADHWLTTLHSQEKMTRQLIRLIEKSLQEGQPGVENALTFDIRCQAFTASLPT